jgi:putative DNA primase/helicase
MCHNLFGDWFTDTPMALGEKDAFQQMQGMWGIELAELDSFNKAENTKAKQFFGSQTDRYRPSYGRMVQEFPRQCVFVGTTNQDTYLKDSTGNRRYWPVMCTKICQDAIKRDRDQLWAEALNMFDAGEAWWPTEKYNHLFEAQQEERFDSDVWEGMIYKWLFTNMRHDYSCAEIMEEALTMDPHAMRPPEQKRVGQIMHRLGFVKKKKLVNGKRPAFYYPPKGFWDAQ